MCNHGLPFLAYLTSCIETWEIHERLSLNTEHEYITLLPFQTVGKVNRKFWSWRGFVVFLKSYHIGSFLLCGAIFQEHQFKFRKSVHMLWGHGGSLYKGDNIFTFYDCRMWFLWYEKEDTRDYLGFLGEYVAMLSFNTFDFQLLSSCSACPVKSLHKNEEPKVLQWALF